ncbi:Hypothetical protein, putative [Bodo saltans]|uniref:Uncharacterized protein n=1 Tax=Bodo saltans TaxID=75058 RepID=A0A0S4IUR5_BODSA|nr:Hypothetical protein, putative [Bodo saltans]|eukprot:CUF94848.1 Hypothetical protein, putative [Bodo saltans]
MPPRSFANLARAAALVLDGTEEDVPSPVAPTDKRQFVPYDEDEKAAFTLPFDAAAKQRKAHHSFIADTLFARKDGDYPAGSHDLTNQESLGPFLASPTSPNSAAWEEISESPRSHTQCLHFSPAGLDHSDTNPFASDDASDPLSSNATMASYDSSVLRQYQAVNFIPPLDQRRHVLVLPSFRELMQEQLSLVGTNTQHTSNQSTSYAISPTVEIPRTMLSQILAKVSTDSTMRSVMMRTYYAALGDTIVSSDRSSPSGAGPSGLSLAQFREMGRVCGVVAREALEEQGVKPRQPLLTSIFECASKPFQFLSLPSFCIALGLLALATRPHHSATETPLDGSGSELSSGVRVLLAKMRWLCDAVLSQYVAASLPIWADPDVDLAWLDTRCQRLMLEYGKISHDIFEIFSVAPGEEIASILRRGSSLSSQRGSTASVSKEPPTLGPTPPKSARTPSKASPLTAVRRPTTAAEQRPARAAVTFVEDNPKVETPQTNVNNVVAAASVRRASTAPKDSDAEATDELLSAMTPSQRLKHYGFDFPASAEVPSYFLQGCDQHRILPLSTLQRVVNAMNVPNVSVDDVTVAAKAASLMYRQHPFRRIAEAMEQAQSRTSRAARGGPTQGSNASLFASGVNPLSRFVPSGDIFILEREFVDVLLRLSVLAFPDLVGSPGFIPRRVRKQSTAERRRSSVALAPRRSTVEVTPGSSNLLDGLKHRKASEVGNNDADAVMFVQTIAGRGEARNAAWEFTFSDALRRMLTTYVEGFYLSATGAGTIDSSRIIVVSAEDAQKMGERESRTKKSFRGSIAPASLDTTATIPKLMFTDVEPDEDTARSHATTAFALALPQVKALSIVASPDEVDYFFQSDASRHSVPGWDSRQHPNIVSEVGGQAVAQGHLMISATGCYMLLEGRVAIRAHRVLASPLTQGKKLSNVEEAAQLPTMCEFRVPALDTLFSENFMRRNIEPHRAIRCGRDGASTFRVYPYTFVSLSVQYSSDGVHWTPTVPDRLHLPKGSLPIDGASSARMQAGRLIMRQVLPTHVVPTALSEALQILFHVYARYQEVVKEDVVSSGKWRHLCASLFYIVSDHRGAPLKCLNAEAESAFDARRRKSATAISLVPAGPASPVIESPKSSVAKECRCTNCRINSIASEKRGVAPLELKSGMGLIVKSSAVGENTSQDDNGSQPTYCFDPSINVPLVTQHHVFEAFEKHSEQRTVHAHTKATGTFSASSVDATTYRVLTFEGMLAALVDMIINHNTTCNREPIPVVATDRLMLPDAWWKTLFGLLVLESERRRKSVQDGNQIDCRDVQRLLGNPHSQLAYKRLWSIDASGLPVTTDVSDAAAQRSLMDVTTTFMSVARRVRSVSIFHHGACIAAVHDDANYQCLTSHRAGYDEPPATLRNAFITVEVFTPAYYPQLQRLVGVHLPYNATLERLFHSHMLPFSIDSSAVFESKPARRGRPQGLTVPDPVVSSARRFWLLKNKIGASLGCMSNLPGQCATIAWVPTVGSYHSPVASLFLMDSSSVLDVESLMLFKYFVESGDFSESVTDDADRTRKWVRAERALRAHLEQCGLSMDPVFP